MAEPTTQPISQKSRKRIKTKCVKSKAGPKGEPKVGHNPNEDQLYEIIDDIKIYDGNSIDSMNKYKHNIELFKNLYGDALPLFSSLEPSTLTSRGEITGINFTESKLIEILPEPTGHIVMFGCNYGEKYNPTYITAAPVKLSARGRKPKVKAKSKRKVQGTGKYFSSQITFEIEHPDSKRHYKIKLFRNGVFQIPGIRDPSMHDIIKPICILRDYLIKNLKNTTNNTSEIKVLYIIAVMRNYKAIMLNDKYHIDLERLEEILIQHKTSINEDIKNYMTDQNDQNDQNNLINPMRIAEMTYNTDRCFCLIIKFNRLSPFKTEEQTTVKLLKRGRINWDGGNSELEIKELYHWLQWIYHKYKDEILFNIDNIHNNDNSDTDTDSIYDEEHIAIIDGITDIVSVYGEEHTDPIELTTVEEEKICLY